METIRGLSIPKSSARALAVSLILSSGSIFEHRETSSLIRCAFRLSTHWLPPQSARCKDDVLALRCTTEKAFAHASESRLVRE